MPADVDFTAALASVPETKVRVRGGVEEEGNEGVGAGGARRLEHKAGRAINRAPPLVLVGAGPYWRGRGAVGAPP